MTQEVPVLLVLPCRKGTFFVFEERPWRWGLPLDVWTTLKVGRDPGGGEYPWVGTTLKVWNTPGWELP